MYFGRVIGSVVATHGIEGLAGNRLLLIERTDELGESLQREEVAVDTVQAGPGDRVVLVSSREAAMALPAPHIVDAAIVGIIDDVELEERRS